MINNKYRIGHFHIFKNAGTSIDRALKKNFGDRWATFEGVHAHDIKTNEELLEYFSQHPNIQAASSHLCRPPLNSPMVLPIVFLRDPLERAKSVYEFTKLDDSQPFRESTTSSFSDYLKWALSNAPGGVVIRNYQVIHLSSASFCEKGILHSIATDINFREAIQIIDSWEVIGVVDQYLQSIKLIETVYRKYFPELRLTYEHENVTNTGCTRKQLENEIGNELYEEFFKQNQLDYKLYDHARRRLDQLSALHIK
jgi:hypothetical protein